MNQPGFDFATSLPVNGKAPRQRHASFTGALQAAGDRPVLTMAYVALLRTLGPHSDQAAAKALGCGLSSINSVRDGLGASVVDSGRYETKTWPNGRTTKRTRWAVAK